MGTNRNKWKQRQRSGSLCVTLSTGYGKKTLCSWAWQLQFYKFFWKHIECICICIYTYMFAIWQLTHLVILWPPNLCTMCPQQTCVCWLSEKHQSAAIVIKVHFTFAGAHWQVEYCTASMFNQFRNPESRAVNTEHWTVLDATNHIKSVLLL